jgi:hypothetical protein
VHRYIGDSSLTLYKMSDAVNISNILRALYKLSSITIWNSFIGSESSFMLSGFDDGGENEDH